MGGLREVAGGQGSTFEEKTSGSGHLATYPAAAVVMVSAGCPAFSRYRAPGLHVLAASCVSIRMYNASAVHLVLGESQVAC